jgi:peptidoglycan/LPS O-acetylase OafA/YrhL
VKLCSIALFVSLLLRIILVAHFGNGLWVWAFTITRADGLYVGSALAAIFALKGQFSNRLLVGLLAGGGAALAIVASLEPPRALWLTGTYMAMVGILGLALLSGGLIVFCLRFSEGPVGRFFQMPWLRNFGKYSYGMYVWHFPIYYSIEHFMEMRGVVFPLPTRTALPYAALLMATSYAAAWLSFNCYEQWFLRLKTHFEPVFVGQPRTQPAPGWIPQTTAVVDRS